VLNQSLQHVILCVGVESALCFTVTVGKCS